MKKTLILILLLLMVTPFGADREISEGFPVTSSVILADEDTHKFGGKRAQNKRNRRTKKLNRRNGVGLVLIEGRAVA